MPPCLMLKHPDPCHDTDTHTPVSTPPSPKLTCALLMVYPCDCFVELALCTPLFAEGLPAWAMNKTRTQHSQVPVGYEQNVPKPTLIFFLWDASEFA